MKILSFLLVLLLGFKAQSQMTVLTSYGRGVDTSVILLQVDAAIATKLNTTIAATTYEPAITAPYVTAKYWNGYKKYASLNTDSVTQGSVNLFSQFSNITGGISYNSGTINIGSATAIASALGSFTSTTQGVLFSRMSTTQMNAIATPAQGLIVFNTSDSGTYEYSGIAWYPMRTKSSATSTGWARSGNVISNRSQFIGSTDTSQFRVRTNNVDRFIIDSSGNAYTWGGSFSVRNTDNTQLFSASTSTGYILTGGLSGPIYDNGAYAAVSVGGILASSGRMKAPNALFGNLQLGLTSIPSQTGYGIGIIGGAIEIDGSGGNSANYGSVFRYYGGGTPQVNSGPSGAVNISQGLGGMNASNLNWASLRINTAINNTISNSADTIIGISYEPLITTVGPAKHVGFQNTYGDNWFNRYSGSTGFGTSTPQAAVDITSTTAGILIPRMTTSQRNAVVSPATGLLVYDITLLGMYHYNGTAWASVAAASSSSAVPSSSVVSGTEITTTSTSDVVATGLTLSPATSGTYAVYLNSQYAVVSGSQTAQAVTDLANAYTYLNGLTVTNSTHASAFGGETITAGVYSIAAAGSAAGNLVLDAQNNSAAVFVFHYGAAFNTGAGTTVSLANGALAQNVYWVAEGAIGLGATTTMVGTLLAHGAAVSLGSACVLTGRMLSTTGAIGIDGSTISTTPASSSCNLGTTQGFAIFTTSGGVTNANASNVTGNIGTNSGTITGFASATVTGTQYTSGTAGYATVTWSIYNNGVLVPYSSRIRTSTSSQDIDLHCITTITAGQAIDVRWNTNLGTAKMENRTFTLVRVTNSQ